MINSYIIESSPHSAVAVSTEDVRELLTMFSMSHLHPCDQLILWLRILCFKWMTASSFEKSGCCLNAYLWSAKPAIGNYEAPPGRPPWEKLQPSQQHGTKRHCLPGKGLWEWLRPAGLAMLFHECPHFGQTLSCRDPFTWRFQRRLPQGPLPSLPYGK